MKCGHPITVNGRMVSCGQCMPCRINSRRTWTGRIMLEQMHSLDRSSFVTLTYNEDHLPKDGTLVPEDFTAYLNRLRGGSLGKVRFFGVGEYGDKSWRPHYHLLLFGVDPLKWEGYLNEKWHDGRKNPAPLGFVHVGECSRESAAYCAGYTTKKMLSKEDDRLQGKYPEFARMSKRPPIGAAGFRHIRELLYTRTGARGLAELGDIPSGVRIAGHVYPVGRYWRRKLREHFGITEPPVNAEWNIDYEEAAIERQKAEQVAVKLWRQTRRTRKTRTL